MFPRILAFNSVSTYMLCCDIISPQGQSRGHPVEITRVRLLVTPWTAMKSLSWTSSTNLSYSKIFHSWKICNYLIHNVLFSSNKIFCMLTPLISKFVPQYIGKRNICVLASSYFLKRAKQTSKTNYAPSYLHAALI